MNLKIFYCSTGLLIIIGCILVIIGLVFELAAFPAILRNTVKKNLVLGLKDDKVTLNEFAHDWINSSYTVKIQYYLWNYTNPIEIVDRGVQPDAYEVGPYGYKQVNFYNYTNDSWIDNGKFFEYIEWSTYYYDPTSSCSTCNPDSDLVRIPDPIFFGFMQQLVQLLPQLSALLGTDLTGLLSLLSFPMFGFKAEPIITVKVSDILFNTYKSPVLTMMEDIYNMFSPDSIYGSLLGLIIQQLISQSVALNTNNATIDNTFWYTINTGKNDIDNVGKIVKIRSPFGGPANTTMPQQWWNGTTTKECPNKEKAVEFVGTNGDYFHPFIDKSDDLQAFVEDICRSVNFVFDKEIKITNDIKTYRYVLDTKSFNYSNPENCGYCSPQPFSMYGVEDVNCLPTGLLDLSGCKTGPIVASLPHFYGADDRVLKWFPRMKPDKEEHQTMLYIEPTTGTVLKAAKRLQINLAAGGFPGTIWRLVPNGTWPLAWVNNSYMADEKTLNDVKNDLYKPRNTVKLVCYIVGVGFGALLILVGVSTIILRSVHQKSKNPSFIITSDDRNNDYSTAFNGDVNDDTNIRRRNL